MAPFNWHARYQEQARWTSQLRQYLYSKLRSNEVKRILEVGCGTGAILSDPDLSNNWAKFGLDVNENHLRLAAQNLKDLFLCLGDGLAIPFHHSCFDIAFCHFYLLWVIDPLQAIEEMKRVTRKGGFIIAMAEPDYGGRIDYPEKYRWIGILQMRALEKQGAHPEIGRQLSSLFAQNGLKGIETGVMGGQWILPNDLELIRNEWQVLKQDFHGLIPDQIIKQYEDMDTLSWQNRERTIFVPTFYAIGQV